MLLYDNLLLLLFFYDSFSLRCHCYRLMGDNWACIHNLYTIINVRKTIPNNSEPISHHRNSKLLFIRNADECNKNKKINWMISGGWECSFLISWSDQVNRVIRQAIVCNVWRFLVNHTLDLNNKNMFRLCECENDLLRLIVYGIHTNTMGYGISGLFILHHLTPHSHTILYIVCWIKCFSLCHLFITITYTVM